MVNFGYLIIVMYNEKQYLNHTDRDDITPPIAAWGLIFFWTFLVFN
jgi:hypothetical protein